MTVDAARWPSVTGLTVTKQRTYTLCYRCGLEVHRPTTNPDRMCRDCTDAVSPLSQWNERKSQERAARDERILAMAQEGATTAEIAEVLGVSQTTVAKARRRLGVAAPRGGYRRKAAS